MSELKDMLQGVAAAKERGFADEDFAGGYGRVVTGRVKRRRAATSVGVGGASVLSASALWPSLIHQAGAVALWLAALACARAHVAVTQQV